MCPQFTLMPSFSALFFTVVDLCSLLFNTNSHQCPSVSCTAASVLLRCVLNSYFLRSLQENCCYKYMLSLLHTHYAVLTLDRKMSIPRVGSLVCLRHKGAS